MVGVTVMVGVMVGVTVMVGVMVGVIVFVGVGVIVLVGVMVGVGVFVGVVVLVGVGDAGMIGSILSSGLNGSINLYLDFNSLKLCLTCPAFRGSTYILNAPTSPIKLPPNSRSRIMFVVKPEYCVLFNMFVGANSGSCIRSLFE